MGSATWILVILVVYASHAARDKGVETTTVSIVASFCLVALIFNQRRRLLRWISDKRSNFRRSKSSLGRFSKTPVQLNDSLFELHKPTCTPTLQILFFHGLQFGDYSDAHFSTWKSGDGTHYWPQTWLVEEFPHAHVLSVSYSSRLRKSSHQGLFDMRNIGENLTWDLIQANIGQDPLCPVVLVGHSFGGLVIKQLCLQAHETVSLTVDSESKKLQKFLDSLHGIFYYGTPHRGSPFVDMVAHFLEGPLLEYVKSLSASAARLDFNFELLCRLYDQWRIAGVGESLPTKLGPFHSVLVPEASALCGESFNLVVSDHFSICKPASKITKTFYCLTGLLHRISQSSKIPKFSDAANFQAMPKVVVGLGQRLEEVESQLSTATSLGLLGMGGIGKTTLAKAVFNRLAPKFEYSCYVASVKKLEGGTEAVHHAVLEHMHSAELKINRGGDGLKFLREKRLLLVLDDIASEEDLDVMFTLKDQTEVHVDSRFIATSRNYEYLKSLDFVYKVPLLDAQLSNNLFMTYAFPAYKAPPPSIMKNVKRLVRKCNGLPLTLEVLGKYLYRNSDLVWGQAFKALDCAEAVAGFDEKLWQKLKLSYDSLDKVDQEMFLDAATFFYGRALHIAKAAWSVTTKGTEHIRWQHLVNMSLVQELREEYPILGTGVTVIHMHDQLQSLGRKIASTCGPHGSCSRISNSQLAWDLLSSKDCDIDEMKEVVSLHLDRYELEDGDRDTDEIMPFTPKTLAKSSLLRMENLQHLQLRGVEIEGTESETFPANLVALQWRHAEFTDLPFDPAFLKSLAVLNLSDCRSLRSLPHNFGHLSALRILEISDAVSLLTLPDTFGQLANLQRLTLECCPKLEIFPDTFGKFGKLRYLRLYDCGFCSLPESLGLGLQQLQHLEISHCDHLRELPESFDQLGGLKKLTIGWCSGLHLLPETIHQLSSLEELELFRCGSLQTLPSSFGHLPGLKKFTVASCLSNKLPESFWKLQALEHLKLLRTYQDSIPESMQNLPRLKTLNLLWGSKQEFPKLPSFLGDVITPRNFNRRVGWTFNVVSGQFSLEECQEDREERLAREQQFARFMKANSKKEKKRRQGR